LKVQLLLIEGLPVKIAVTGSTGHLGRLAVHELLATQPPADIVAVVRDAAKAQDLSALGVDVRVAAYEDAAALDQALVGVDRLLLISGSEVGRRVSQHENVIGAAQRAGVELLVYTSAPKATTSPLILAPEHKATEELLADSGLPYAVVRNGWYTENYLGQLETARQTQTVVAAVGDGRVASASRVDYAAGAVAVLLADDQAGQVYELSGDHAWDFHELAAAISEIIGTPVTYRAVDAATLVDILTGVGLDEGTAGFVAALDGNIAEGLLGETSHDLSRLIGRPTTPLVEGLRAALADRSS
jgi:NAD(P)H dehydrogenase (quinone)